MGRGVGTGQKGGAWTFRGSAAHFCGGQMIVFQGHAVCVTGRGLRPRTTEPACRRGAGWSPRSLTKPGGMWAQPVGCSSLQAGAPGAISSLHILRWGRGGRAQVWGGSEKSFLVQERAGAPGGRRHARRREQQRWDPGPPEMKVCGAGEAGQERHARVYPLQVGRGGWG